MTKSTFIILALIAVGVLIPVLLQNQERNPDRTPWADQYTQQFETHADGSSSWSGGLFYYSWIQKAFKISFQRSVHSTCQVFGGYLSQCSFLVLDNAFYIMFPAKKICFLWNNQMNFTAPYQTAIDSVYLNTTTVNGTDYYVWTSKSNSFYTLYTSTDKRQINVWQYELSSGEYLSEYRYLDKSYYPNIEKQVFQLPEFCQKPSKGYNFNNQQKNVLKKLFKIKNGSGLRKLD